MNLRFSLLRVIVLVGALASLLVLAPAAASPGTVERVSVDSDGNEANGHSRNFGPAMSADGRFVAFGSEASNLFPGDSNNRVDLFVHDRETGDTERVNLSSSGGVQDFEISADGRFVTFHSNSSDLVLGDTNGRGDIFVYDRQADVTERVSVSSAGVEANDDSTFPDISGDGRFVVFESDASNLVPDDTNGQDDIFVHDRLTGVTELVSVDSTGTQANALSAVPAISADGRFVVFYSYAWNLVPNDTNERPDVFVHDRTAGTTERVSVSSLGDQANNGSFWPAISADGQFVAFESFASNLVPVDTNDFCDRNFDGILDNCRDIFLHDRLTGVTELVSVDSAGAQGDSSSFHPAMSDDGRLVAFDSEASNLVPGDTNGVKDVFVHDRQTGATTRVSTDNAGAQGNGRSRIPALSSDGQFVAFESLASNLVEGDTNLASDIFVHDVQGIPCRGLTPTIVGTEGKDVIIGTNGRDVIHGLGGDDHINGKGGDDVICGGDGADHLQGGGQNDVLDGGTGDDRLHGGRGTDECDGAEGTDVARSCESLVNVP